jgi:hypothetical protein
MIRIIIDWDYLSPTLGVVSGICSVDNVNYANRDNQVINIIKCKVTVERGSIGFSGLKEGEGVPSKLFDKFRKEISEIAHSYHRGMLLEDCTYYWYDEDNEINIKEIEENQKDYEKMYEMVNHRDESLYKPTGVNIIKRKNDKK